MGVGMTRFPDPYQRRDDLSHATVFLVVLVLLIAIGAVLFFGSSWAFSPPSSVAGLGLQPRASVSQARPTSAAQPTFGAPTPVPALAGVPLQPTPKPGQTPQPIPTSAPHPAAAPMVTPTPAPLAPQVGYVGNTGGDGVYLRHTPRLKDTWVAWPDNTKLTILGAEANGDGTHWLQVRDPRGNVGWVPAQFVRR